MSSVVSSVVCSALIFRVSCAYSRARGMFCVVIRPVRMISFPPGISRLIRPVVRLASVIRGTCCQCGKADCPIGWSVISGHCSHTTALKGRSAEPVRDLVSYRLITARTLRISRPTALARLISDMLALWEAGVARQMISAWAAGISFNWQDDHIPHLARSVIPRVEKVIFLHFFLLFMFLPNYQY